MTDDNINPYLETITLRGHHLLCIQGFQGYGYSEDFIENMDNIIHLLESPQQRIRIVAECDDICLSCPYMEQNSCVTPSSTDNIIKTMDHAVMDYLNLEEKLDYIYQDLQQQILHEENYNNLKEICGTCSWRKDCKFYKKEF